MTYRNEHFQVKMYELKGILRGIVWHTTASLTVFYVILFVGEGSQGRRRVWSDGEMNGIGVNDVKSTKNQ